MSHSIYVREMQPPIQKMLKSFDVSHSIYVREMQLATDNGQPYTAKWSHSIYVREMQQRSAKRDELKSLSHSIYVREMQLRYTRLRSLKCRSHSIYVREMQQQKLCKLYSTAIQFLSHLLTHFV